MFSLVKLLPLLLNFLSDILSFFKSEKDKESGRSEERAKELTIADEQTTKAKTVEESTKVIHTKDTTDTAFDNEFQRD